MTYSDDMTEEEYLEYLDYDHEAECAANRVEEHYAEQEFYEG